MFGTIGTFKIKPGADAVLTELDEAWMKEFRPSVPGPVLMFRGTVDGKPDERVMVFLCQDKETYFKIADDPRQDEQYQKMTEHVEGEITWTDIQVDEVTQD